MAHGEVGFPRLLRTDSFASNDYLGLARHPAVVAAAREAVAEYGAGSTGARLISGNLAIHEELEREIAALKGTEAALLFQSGYQAAVGTIPALVGPGDLILSDALNHACLIDGTRLSRAAVRVYRHGDFAHAVELLADRAAFRRCLVVTDGVFSMDGDLAPLAELADLCDEFEAWLMVDDAHGTGVLGDTGAGTAEYLGVSGRVTIQMGTFSKALGASGGFISGSRVLIDHLINTARSFVFTTAPSPASSGAALAAMRIIRDQPESRIELVRNADSMRDGLRDLGLVVPFRSTPILPVLIGDAVAAVALSDALRAEGLAVPAIRPPTVAEGTSRLRVTVTSTHGESDIAHAVNAFERAMRRLSWI